MIYLFIALAGATFLLTSCENPPSSKDEIKKIDDHIYIWERGWGSKYCHDTKCPECQKLNQKLTTEQISSN